MPRATGEIISDKENNDCTKWAIYKWIIIFVLAMPHMPLSAAGHTIGDEIDTEVVL